MDIIDKVFIIDYFYLKLISPFHQLHTLSLSTCCFSTAEPSSPFESIPGVQGGVR